MKDVIEHYDKLIDENNDPVYDAQPLQIYMDKWDGQSFIDKMSLNRNKSVLEIGVGTGRLAVRVAPLCRKFCGIDISPKTIERAHANLSSHTNVSLICSDFLTYSFSYTFDVIYSSLTFMHIENKKSAINKVGDLLNDDGIFVLSIDKNQRNCIDMGTRKIKTYPDDPYLIKQNIADADLSLTDAFETEFAYILVSKKSLPCAKGGGTRSVTEGL